MDDEVLKKSDGQNFNERLIREAKNLTQNLKEAVDLSTRDVVIISTMVFSGIIVVLAAMFYESESHKQQGMKASRKAMNASLKASQQLLNERLKDEVPVLLKRQKTALVLVDAPKVLLSSRDEYLVVRDGDLSQVGHDVLAAIRRWETEEKR